MASLVKVARSDITDRAEKEFLTNIVKHAFSTLINTLQFVKRLEKEDANEIIKDPDFRNQFMDSLREKLLRGNFTQYIAVMAQEFDLQVKYKKKTMI